MPADLELPDGISRTVSGGSIDRIGGSLEVVDRPTGGAAERVEFYPSLAPICEVTITAEARKQIDREFDSMLRDCRAGLLPGDYAETGGFLLVDPDRPLEILTATGPGNAAKYGPSSIVFDREAAGNAFRSHPKLRIAGDWHVHFGLNGRPSETDRSGWSDLVGVDGGDAHIGLIVRAESAWEHELCGWITYTEAGHTICEPLALREAA